MDFVSFTAKTLGNLFVLSVFYLVISRGLFSRDCIRDYIFGVLK